MTYDMNCFVSSYATYDNYATSCVSSFCELSRDTVVGSLASYSASSSLISFVSSFVRSLVFSSFLMPRWRVSFC